MTLPLFEIADLRRIRQCALGSILLVAAGATAAAPRTSGHSYDSTANVSVASVPVLAVGSNDEVQFADKTSAYENSQSTESFDSGSGLLARLQTGTLGAETQWLPSDGFLAVGSRATANDVDLSVVDGIGGGLLGLHAPLVRPTAIITGTCPVAVRLADLVHIVDDCVLRDGIDIPNLEASSTAIVQETEPGDSIVLSIDGTDVLNIPTDPGVNVTVATGVAGATLILNEQISSGDGFTGPGVATNALHLSLDIVGIITADVAISHLEASIA